MIIKEVTIQNFRSYYGTTSIKFNDGLVLFIGDNGDGKTTFFEALEWLFDTSRKSMESRLISQKRIEELPDLQSDILRVSMIFEHEGEHTVEKSFLFTKDNGEISTSDFQFKGLINDGSQRLPWPGGTLLDHFFEPAIRKYCLFKGEENLNIFTNEDALNYLIETFSNIRQFDPYYTGDIDECGFTDYAEVQSRRAYEKAMRSDKQNSAQERDLSSNMELVRNDLNSLRIRLKTYRENAANYSKKLNEIESSKEASELLKDINERLKSINEKKTTIEQEIKEDYTIKLLDEMWVLCGFNNTFEEFQLKVSNFSTEKRQIERNEDINKGKRELAAEISKGIIPLSPNIPDKISMQEMIKDEFCKVCGREAKKGSEAYNFMLNKLNTLLSNQLPKIKEEKPLFPNNFVKELEQKSNNLDNQQEYINNLINDIKESFKFNEDKKKEVKFIQESIVIEEDNKKKILAQNDNFTEEQLRNAYENIQNWWSIRMDAEREIALLEQDEQSKLNELELLRKSYDNLAKNSLASTYSKVYTALNKIMEAFKHAKEKNTYDFLKLLEQKANHYLEKLNIDGFHGIIRIIRSSDGSARMVLHDTNDTSIVSPNQALKTTMYMSVLFAVSELTTIKRENDYPLIFDAPTSSFAPQKEIDFFNVISDIKKQCIIFTKSFLDHNSIVDYEKIKPLNCTIYRMEKKQPYNKLDLSTIHTGITLLK